MVRKRSKRALLTTHNMYYVKLGSEKLWRNSHHPAKHVIVNDCKEYT